MFTGPDKRRAKQIGKEAMLRIVAAVERVRKANGHSVNFVADAAGLGRGTLSRIYAGHANLTVATLAQLSYGLGIDIAELFGDAKLEVPPKLKRGRPVTRRRRKKAS